MHTRLLAPADDAQMRRFHEILWRAEKEDGRSWNPMWTYEELAGMFRQETSEHRNIGVLAVDGDQVVGAGFAMLSMLDNTSTAWVFAAVEPQLRGRGIGAVVLDGLLELAQREGRTQLLGGAGIPFEERETSPIIVWAKEHGFSVANVEIQRHLDLPVDDALLDRMAATAAERHADYEVRTFVGRIPDELLASWCDLSNLFMLEAPLGEVEAEAGRTTPEAVRQRDELTDSMGRTVYRAVALHGDTVVAHSDLGVPPDAHEAHQWGTLVHPDHRGHRLGAAVKVANLRQLQEGHPKVPHVVTTNAETNAWMVAINEELGFHPVAVVPTFRRVL